MPKKGTPKLTDLKLFSRKLEARKLSISDIGAAIPITELADKLDINKKILEDRLKKSGDFSVTDIVGLANVLELSYQAMFDILVEERNR